MSKGIFVVKFSNGEIGYFNEVQLIAAGISPLASNVIWSSVANAERFMRSK